MSSAKSSGSAVGTFLGTTFSLISLVSLILMTFVVTTSYLQLLIYLVAGLIGAYGLGSLNSEKAQSDSSYRNEYVLYASLGFVGSVILSVLLIFLDPTLNGTLVKDNPFKLNELGVILTSLVSEILLQLGLGLVINNLTS